MKISLLFLGTTGAGPVYSYEMARALLSKGCQLQIFVSKFSQLFDLFEKEFSNNELVEFHAITPYKATLFSFVCSWFKFRTHHYIIKNIRQFDPECVYSPFTTLWGPVIYGPLKGKVRIINTIHDVIPHDEKQNAMARFWGHLIHKYNIKIADDIILLSDFCTNILKRNYCKDKICVIPHANFSFYKNKSTQNTSLNFRIGIIGRIEPYKGVELLIDAFRLVNHTNVKLTIAGSGDIDLPQRKYIEEDERITRINKWLEDDEIEQIIQSFDMLVLPYLNASQSGIIPLAFALGKPVIVTDVGALREQVPSGTGVVVDVDKAAIANAIDDYYDNPSRIIEDGKRAQAYAVNDLSWDKSADLLINYITRL